MSTLGKTVTLRKGLVVTDIGAGIANGEPDEMIRRCLTDDGRETLIIARVIEELPPTYRRAEVRGALRHARQLEPCHAGVIHGDPAVCDACRQTACKPVCRDGGVYCGDESACNARRRQERSQRLLTSGQGS